MRTTLFTSEIKRKMSFISSVFRRMSGSVGEEQVGRSKDAWRIVCISDTHAQWADSLENIPDGDILIHAGDFSNTGLIKEVEGFRKRLESLPHRHKVFIAGNHDITMHKEFYVSPDGHMRFHGTRLYKKDGRTDDGLSPEEYSDRCIAALTCPDDSGSLHYLQDQSVLLSPITETADTVADPLHIYGSPWQPTFCDWAFNVDIPKIKPYWDRIPDEVDVLITHGPPHNVLDAAADGYRCGCPELRAQIDTQRIRPRLHVFGHIHEAYGKTLHVGDLPAI